MDFFWRRRRRRRRKNNKNDGNDDDETSQRMCWIPIRRRRVQQHTLVTRTWRYSMSIEQMTCWEDTCAREIRLESSRHLLGFFYSPSSMNENRLTVLSSWIIDHRSDDPLRQRPWLTWHKMIRWSLSAPPFVIEQTAIVFHISLDFFSRLNYP